MTGSADDKTLLGAGRSIPDGLCPGQPSESLIEEGTAVAGIDLESKPDQTSLYRLKGSKERRACRKTNLGPEPVQQIDKILVTHPENVSGDLP